MLFIWSFYHSLWCVAAISYSAFEVDELLVLKIVLVVIACFSASSVFLLASVSSSACSKDMVFPCGVCGSVSSFLFPPLYLCLFSDIFLLC